jgi:uncharacterized membrane protein
MSAVVVATTLPAEVAMEIVAPGIRAPEGSAICPRTVAVVTGVAGTAATVVAPEGATGVAGVCACAANTAATLNARKIRK